MLATKQERDMILEMLAGGQITTDEARRLFDAVECCAEIAAENEILSPIAGYVDIVSEPVRAGICGLNEAFRQAVVWEA